MIILKRNKKKVNTIYLLWKNMRNMTGYEKRIPKGHMGCTYTTQNCKGVQFDLHSFFYLFCFVLFFNLYLTRQDILRANSYLQL